MKKLILAQASVMMAMDQLIEAVDRLSVAIEKLEAIPTTPEIEKKIISGITSEEL